MASASAPTPASRHELIELLGVGETLGTCPFCAKPVETGDLWHREEIQNGEEGFNGIAYVHDGCGASAACECGCGGLGYDPVDRMEG